MEILRDIILFLHIYRFEILLVILLSFLGFLYWAFPKIEKKIIEKNKLLDEKDETLSGARIHYKDLLIEVKSLRVENESLKQKVLEVKLKINLLKHLLTWQIFLKI